MQTFRSNEIVFVARIMFGQSSFMHPVYNDTRFVRFREELCRRHKIGLNDLFSLVYYTPGSVECMMHCEQDFRMMLYASKVYCLKEIDVVVHLESAASFSKGSVELVDLNLPSVENEYLGLPFKIVETKSYLSDEYAFYITGVGQKFTGGVSEFCDKLKKYAIQCGFFYFYARNDSTYIKVVCEDMDCKFFIKGSVFSANKSFYIEECVLSHTCTSVLRKSTHQRLDSDLVGNCLVTDVMYNPNIGPTEIKRKFNLNYGFDIGYKVALNAKVKALEKIFGKEADSFDKLRWYTDAIKRTNPGSYVDLEVDQVTNRFSRVFVVYGGCVEGLKHCVSILYVDGCFGRSMYKGQILAATSKDGNKEMVDEIKAKIERRAARFQEIQAVSNPYERHTLMLQFLAKEVDPDDSSNLFCENYCHPNLFGHSSLPNNLHPQHSSASDSAGGSSVPTASRNNPKVKLEKGVAGKEIDESDEVGRKKPILVYPQKSLMPDGTVVHWVED